MKLRPWSSSIRVLAVIAAIAATLALVACGGDDDGEGGDGGGDDEADIEAVLEAAIIDQDPAVCEDNVTEDFLDEFYDGDVEACQEDIEADEPADSIDVSDVEIDGEEAEATVTVEGGDTDGQELTVSLVKEDDEWKIDDFEAAEGEETTETETTETETTETETTETETTETTDTAQVEQDVIAALLAYGSSSGAEGCQFLSSELLSALGGQQGCAQEFADSPSVTFEPVSVEVTGDTAVATMRNTESNQTQTYEMVLENGEWLINGLR